MSVLTASKTADHLVLTLLYEVLLLMDWIDTNFFQPIQQRRLFVLIDNRTKPSTNNFKVMFFINTPIRTIFYISVFSVITLSCTNNSTSVEMNQEQPESQIEGTVTLDNNGAQSYTISSIEGDGIQAETDTPNTAIELEIGGRYTFINNAGASSHPLDFRNADRDKLFGQSNSSGSFDDDNDVNVSQIGDAISFTLTEELAEQLFDYICSFHPPMNGMIAID